MSCFWVGWIQQCSMHFFVWGNHNELKVSLSPSFYVYLLCTYKKFKAIMKKWNQTSLFWVTSSIALSCSPSDHFFGLSGSVFKNNLFGFIFLHKYHIINDWYVTNHRDLEQMEPKVISLTPSEGGKLIILLHNST